MNNPFASFIKQIEKESYMFKYINKINLFNNTITQFSNDYNMTIPGINLPFPIKKIDVELALVFEFILIYFSYKYAKIYEHKLNLDNYNDTISVISQRSYNEYLELINFNKTKNIEEIENKYGKIFENYKHILHAYNVYTKQVHPYKRYFWKIMFNAGLTKIHESLQTIKNEDEDEDKDNNISQYKINN